MINKLKQQKLDIRFMKASIYEAKKARRGGDYAIGSVITKNGKIIARTGTKSRTSNDPTAHNEVVALRMAAKKMKNRHLIGCTLYSTCAPCPMCITACVWAKIDRVVYGSHQSDMVAYSKEHGEYKLGNKAEYLWRGTEIEPIILYNQYLKIAHPTMEIRSGVMRKECNRLFSYIPNKK